MKLIFFFLEYISSVLNKRGAPARALLNMKEGYQDISTKKSTNIAWIELKLSQHGGFDPNFPSKP